MIARVLLKSLTPLCLWSALSGCGDFDLADGQTEYIGDAGADSSDGGRADVSVFDLDRYPPSYFDGTVVSLTFDDGLASQWAVRDILGSNGQPATFYIISQKIGHKGYLSLEQLRVLAMEGHEIGGHTRTHTDALLGMSVDEQQAEACGGKGDLETLGFTIKTFAYPYNKWNDQLREVLTGCGFRAARRSSGIAPLDCATQCVRRESLPPGDPLALRTVRSVSDSDTPEDLTRYVINAASEGQSWVIFVFHFVCDPSCGDHSITPTALQQFSDWLSKKQIRVKPLGEEIELSR